MVITGSIIEFVIRIACGIACGVFVVWHECRWRSRLRQWQRTQGVIVKKVAGVDVPKPEIEFLYNGKPKRFTSIYGHDFIKEGKNVQVIFDPSTGKAEQYSIFNRWLFTIVPALGSAMIIYDAISRHILND